MERDSIIFYKSFYEAIKNIPNEEQLKLYNAIFSYSFTETEPKIEEGIAKAMFILMKPNIDSANARYKASIENGKKGGRPKSETQEKPNNNPTITQEKPNDNPTKTQDKPSQNLNYNVDDNVDDNIKKEKVKKEKSFQDVFNENNFSDEFTNVLKDFIVMRKTIKKPMTTKALELLLKNLDRLTNLEAEKIAILNQSIENSWQTVYPLKNLEVKKNFDKQKSTSEEPEFFEYDTNILTQEEYGRLMKGQMSKEELKQIVKERTGEKNV